MGAGAKIRGAAIAAYLGRGPRIVRRWHRVKRAVTRRPRVVTLYHQVDDPYSHLLVQALRPVVARCDVQLRPVLVPPPAADADPEPAKRLAFALRDARELAEHLSVDFPAGAVAPPADRTRRVNAVLLAERPAAEWLEVAVRLGDALWRDDGDALAAMVRQYGTVPGQAVRPTLEANYQALRKAGHYMGAMLHYEGEWYWGIDRLPYLVARLVAEGAAEVFEPVTERGVSVPAAPVVDGRVPVEVFFSFRSPYSYLAIERLRQLRDTLPMDLVLRPVLPMVTRGLTVPRDKVLYITRDAKREADRLGIPFGRICDPLGEGVARCIAVFCRVHQARGARVAHDFAAAAFAGIWSRAVDVATDAGLRQVATEAGVEDCVQAALADEPWRATVEDNRLALSELGLWGVPSFRLGSWSTWGQDRLWMVERRVEAALAGAGDEPEG